MSSIDIRHHICRQNDPERSLYDMLNNLAAELVDLRNQNYLLNVVLTHTMGIEDESRELPKTGFYKGTPYYGDWHQRNEARSYYNSKIDEIVFMMGNHSGFKWSQVRFPEYFFEVGGKLKFDVMEKPQSVHLAPEHYKYDFENNKERW